MRLPIPARGKRGITLVEVVVACGLLVVVVAALITAIFFANRVVSKNIAADDDYTRAQGIADTLITAVSRGERSGAALAEIAGAEYYSYGHEPEPVPDAARFSLVPYERDGIRGFRIYVIVYDSQGGQGAKVTAFAADTGGAFD